MVRFLQATISRKRPLSLCILGGRLREVRLYAEVNDVRCVRRSCPNLYNLVPNAFIVQWIYGADRKDRSLWEDNENL